MSCILIALAITCPAVAQAEDPIPDDFRESTLELMQLTGADQIGIQIGAAMGTQVFDALVGEYAELTDEDLEIITEEFEAALAARIDVLMEELVVLYARYFTHEDILGMIEFYETPLGQKTVRVLPQLMQEAMAVGQAWGQELGAEIGDVVVERLQERGVLPPDPDRETGPTT
jgi:hypothetical protein